MRRTIRTTTVALGAVAATGLGLTTALAASDTTTTTPMATTTATPTPTPTPTAVADPPPSYSMTSPTITVPVNPVDYPNTPGLCWAGYHVAGDWQDAPTEEDPDEEVYVPSVHANGDSDIYVYARAVDDDTQEGTDSNGRPYYQGLDVTLGNHSWLHAKSGTFTWTCEPN